MGEGEKYFFVSTQLFILIFRLYTKETDLSDTISF